MSDAITRPMDPPLDPTEMDNDIPPIPGMTVSGVGHSNKQDMLIDNSHDNSINDALPWVVIAIVATVACTLSGMAISNANNANADSQRAEQRANDAEKRALDAEQIARRSEEAFALKGNELQMSFVQQVRAATDDAKARIDRETRLLRLEIDELKVAIATQGIKIHEGSSP